MACASASNEDVLNERLQTFEPNPARAHLHQSGVPRIVLMTSGGLDSLCSEKVVERAAPNGIDIWKVGFIEFFLFSFFLRSFFYPSILCFRCLQVHIRTPFLTDKGGPEVDFKITVGNEYFEMLKHPRFKKGRAFNPCMGITLRFVSEL